MLGRRDWESSIHPENGGTDRFGIGVAAKFVEKDKPLTTVSDMTFYSIHGHLWTLGSIHHNGMLYTRLRFQWVDSRQLVTELDVKRT